MLKQQRPSYSSEQRINILFRAVDTALFVCSNQGSIIQTESKKDIQGLKINFKNYERHTNTSPLCSYSQNNGVCLEYTINSQSTPIHPTTHHPHFNQLDTISPSHIKLYTLHLRLSCIQTSHPQPTNSSPSKPDPRSLPKTTTTTPKQ